MVAAAIIGSLRTPRSGETQEITTRINQRIGQIYTQAAVAFGVTCTAAIALARSGLVERYAFLRPRSRSALGIELLPLVPLFISYRTSPAARKKKERWFAVTALAMSLGFYGDVLLRGVPFFVGAAFKTVACTAIFGALALRSNFFGKARDVRICLVGTLVTGSMFLSLKTSSVAHEVLRGTVLAFLNSGVMEITQLAKDPQASSGADNLNKVLVTHSLALNTLTIFLFK